MTETLAFGGSRSAPIRPDERARLFLFMETPSVRTSGLYLRSRSKVRGEQAAEMSRLISIHNKHITQIF